LWLSIRAASISPILFPTIIHNAAKYYNNAYILVEINNNHRLPEIIHADLEYENLVKIMTGNKSSTYFCLGLVEEYRLGVRMTPLVKRAG
jgi:hypothetical protein